MILEVIFFVSIFLVIYNVFLYPCLIFLLAKIFHNEVKSANTNIKVSLICSANNEEKDIGQKIKNCLELNYENLEIIIIDDGSTDKTNEICNEYKKKYGDKFKLIEINPRGGKINALNKAVPKSCGEILLFSDANTYYDKNVVKELVKHFADRKVGCVTGHVKLIAKNELKEGEGFFTRIERTIHDSESSIYSSIGLDGAMYALRRELYEPLEGYFIEDFVMGMNIIKKGYRVIYESKAKGWEESAKSYVMEMKRRSRIVAGGFQCLKFMTFLIKKPFILFEFTSHKFLRWILAELMVLILVLNIVLFNSNVLFQYLLYAQILFYFLSIMGFFIKKLSFITYFVLMQIASFLGLIKFIFGLQKVNWTRFKR
ncbi:glycosyltransferase family 2 protein [Candidatus Woesearchaeota archaeon]|nr:glycosyltransferase family 2 protein [Candidatus Woesearchaeota archaeon]